jgi:hypothetical protein
MPNQIRIDLQGKLDKDGCKFYASTDPMPATIDLNTAVILIFPWVEGEQFGAEMVIKHRSIQSLAHRQHSSSENSITVHEAPKLTRP